MSDRHGRNRKVNLGFSALVGIMSMLVIVAITSFLELANANRWNIHTYQVLMETRGIREGLTSIQAEARGVVVTGDRSYLNRLTASRLRFSRHWREAQRLTVDNPPQQDRLRRLRELYQTWTRLYVEPVVASHPDRFSVRSSLDIKPLSLHARVYADQMDALLSDLESTESNLLGQRRGQAERLQRWTLAIVATGGLFACLLALGLASQLSANLRRLSNSNEQLAAEVDERNRTQAKLMAATSQLEATMGANQRILNYSLDVICTLDKDGHFTQVSPACKNAWGYTPEEMAGRPFQDFIHPDDLPASEQMSRDVMAGFAASNFGNRFLRKDGFVAPMVWSATWSAADNTMFCVARDDTERKQAEGAIRHAMGLAEEARQEAERAQAEAEQANAAKSELLSRTSHELRTPLNAILGFAQLMELDELDSAQASAVGQILKGGRHLLLLVNKVLDIASIEEGRMTISTEPVHLGPLLNQAVQVLQPLSIGRHVTIEQDVDGACVMADQQRLKQVLLNLLSNAIQFNRDGGTVRLSSRSSGEGERVRLEISDTGYGISEEGLLKVFAPFERLDAARKGVEGTGIGLTISQRLVELMQGEIGVRSVENEGSTFWIDLPGAEPPLEAHRRTELAPTNGAEPATSELTATILYIEDNVSNLELIEHILSRWRKTLLLAAMQGRRGLDMAREHHPDLILLDVHLPDMSGQEVLQQLQEQEGTRDIPVVILSADATPRQIERLLQAGAKEYLTKPLDVKRFLEVVKSNILGESEGQTVYTGLTNHAHPSAGPGTTTTTSTTKSGNS